MSKKIILILSFLLITKPYAKEIALTFDDAPEPSSKNFESHNRTNELIRKLKALEVPPVMIFANPCKRQDTANVIKQLNAYREAGHLIGNHTCSHPRLDTVGYDAFSKDAARADTLLQPLFTGQKFFRFPYLNESNDVALRDQMRVWLKNNNYRNGLVSIDDDDYIFSTKVNQAIKLNKTVDYKKVKKLFIEHIMGAVNYYDDLAVKTIGYSPKHVILLHEVDITVMFIDSLVKELRAQGWTIISVEDAYTDKVYLEQPINAYANNGFTAQLALEKTGNKVSYNQFDKVKGELNKILDLKNK